MKKINGIILALIAATLWGISGVSGQFLFEQRGINPEWLVTVRLLVSGVILLAYAKSKNIDIWQIFRHKKDTIQLLVFGIFGMMAVQLSYFKAINLSNAATATVLQFLGPVFIILYLAFKNRKMPNMVEGLSLAMAMFGMFLVVSHGNVKNLSLSGIALFWGVISGLFLAIYTIQPIELFNKYHSAVVVGWGMFIGGFVLNIFYPSWHMVGRWDNLTYINLFSVILFGGVIAFFAFGEAVKIIGAQHSSIIITVEPISAAVFAILFLNVSFGMVDWTGSACVMVAIMLLSMPKRVPKQLSADRPVTIVSLSSTFLTEW